MLRPLLKYYSHGRVLFFTKHFDTLSLLLTFGSKRCNFQFSILCSLICSTFSQLSLYFHVLWLLLCILMAKQTKTHFLFWFWCLDILTLVKTTVSWSTSTDRNCCNPIARINVGNVHFCLVRVRKTLCFGLNNPVSCHHRHGRSP